jgi:hypothetical protein
MWLSLFAIAIALAIGLSVAAILMQPDSQAPFEPLTNVLA